MQERSSKLGSIWVSAFVSSKDSVLIAYNCLGMAVHMVCCALETVITGRLD